MDQMVPHWLTKQASLSPNKTAIETEEGITLTFKEMKSKSEIFARKLTAVGVEKGNRIAILSNNSLDMVIAIHALSYLGAVIVILNIKLTKSELQYQLQASNSTLLLTTEQLQKDKQLDFQKQYTFTESHSMKEKRTDLMTEINLQDPFTMMFTSGTTGKPKAVVHTYGNHWWSAIGSALNLGLEKDDKWLLTLPVFHVGGFSILMKSIIYGMEVFLLKKYDASHFYKALHDKKITIVSLVTVMLKDLLASLGTDKLPGNVRCLLLGGGSVPTSILAEVEEKQLPLFQSYGMTETSSQIVNLSADDVQKKIGSSGKPLFPAQLKIIDQNEEGIGEIAVKGPMVMAGYDNTEANGISFLNDWFKTGDLGYTDSDGFLFVVDRRTDLIISGGENIYPQEIENVLLEMTGIVEAAIAGKEDDKWGQVPVAFIVRENNAITKEKILTFAADKLASYKTPKEVHFVTVLPRNASNKIMRHQLLNKNK